MSDQEGGKLHTAADQYSSMCFSLEARVSEILPSEEVPTTNHKSHYHDELLDLTFDQRKYCKQQTQIQNKIYLSSVLAYYTNVPASLYQSSVALKRMSLSARSTASGRSTTAAALIDDVTSKRMVVLSLKEKLEGHKTEEENMASDLRSSILNETELGHDILDLRAFIKDDPNDKKAKKKLEKLEAKLQIELQLAIAKRTDLKAA